MATELEQRIRMALIHFFWRDDVQWEPEDLAPWITRALEAAITKAVLSCVGDLAQTLNDDELMMWVKQEKPPAINAFIKELERDEVAT